MSAGPRGSRTRRRRSRSPTRGAYLRPTLFEIDVARSSSTREVFGPVLHVMR